MPEYTLVGQKKIQKQYVYFKTVKQVIKLQIGKNSLYNLLEDLVKDDVLNIKLISEKLRKHLYNTIIK